MAIDTTGGETEVSSCTSTYIGHVCQLSAGHAGGHSDGVFVWSTRDGEYLP